MTAFRVAISCWLLAGVCLAKPSVIVVLTDDQGWGDLSLHGNTNLATPNLDRLARQGAQFERFYVEPVCSPTRAELLTGRYAPRDGVFDVTAGGERLDSSVPTIADAFRASGYATAAFGKWHNGTQPPYHPLCRGFDRFYGFTSGHWGNYFDPMIDNNGRITKGVGYLPDDLTDHAIRFVREQSDRPYFLYLAYNTPHGPMQTPQRWWDPHAKQKLALRGTRADRERVAHTRAALAMVENLDWNMGRLLEAVDGVDNARDTIIVFFNDNGPNGHRFNGGMRGVKGSTDEGGVRSPLFVRWPDQIERGTIVTTPAAAIDLLPTLGELADVPLPDDPPRDGLSHAAELRGQHAAPRERTLFAHWNDRVSARRGSLVLDERGRLYDLANDPGQQRELTNERTREAQSLRDAVARWRSEVGLDQPRKPRPFTIGGPRLRTTQLPARDATTRGGLKRSNHYFNSTFFTNWRSIDDAILWDAEVREPGRYAATLYYTCREENVGAAMRLSFASTSVVATVRHAHDPPLLGPETDRYPRKSGYVKDFRPMPLGVIELPADRGELVLTADSIPGESAIDFRLLVLERLVE